MLDFSFLHFFCAILNLLYLRSTQYLEGNHSHRQNIQRSHKQIIIYSIKQYKMLVTYFMHHLDKN